MPKKLKAKQQTLSKSKKNSNQNKKKKNNKQKMPQPQPIMQRRPKARQLVKMNKQRNRVVSIHQPNGTVDKYTAKQLQQIRASGLRLPENYVSLLRPNMININNIVATVKNPKATGIALNFEALVDCIIANAVAKAPHLAPPAISYLKFYCYWCLIERFRNESLQGLMGNSALFGKDIIPDFDENSWAIPVALATFIEHVMPWKDPGTNTEYKYSIDWATFWSESAGNIPNITGPSITANAAQTDIFNRSSIGNSVLTEVTPMTMLATQTQEITYGVSPNAPAGSFTMADAIVKAVDISNYWKEVGTFTFLSEVPFKGRDGTAYAYVSSAQSTFPGIYSNTTFYDEEYAFMFHQVTDPQINNNSSQTFRKITPLPTVLYDIYPNANPPAFPTATPAQIGMLANFAYICNLCQYKKHQSRYTLLRSCWNVYNKLSSFQPNFFILDLNAFHQLVESTAVQIQQVTLGSSSTIDSGTGMPLAGGTQLSTYSDMISYLVTLESALLAHMMKFSWAGLVFYSNSDIASGTAISSNFLNVVLPPLIADYISGIGPAVMDNKLYTPLLYWGQASSLYPGTAFQGLNVTYDYASSRWLNLANPIGAPAIGTGVYPSMYVPSTVPSTSTVPPDSLDRLGPYAYSLTYAGLPNLLQWSLNLAGGASFAVTQASILPAASTPDLTIAPTSRYVPITPNRIAKQVIRGYSEYVNKVSQSFILADDNTIGNLAQFCPVLFDTPPLALQSFVFRSNLTNTSTPINVFATIDVMVTQVGSQLPLDTASLGNVIQKAYRRIPPGGDVKLMPFIYTASSNTSVVEGLIMDTIRPPGQATTFMMEYEATKAKMSGYTPVSVLRTVLAPYFKSLAPINNPMHKGEAAAIVIKCLKTITTAPFSPSNVDLSTFNSPNGVQQAIEAAGSIGGVALPIISPLIAAGRDLFHFFFN